MDVVATSLEALIQRATNPQNEKPDIAAIEAFCVMLGKESKGIHVAGKLLATHVQSNVEKEALQALTVLDTCMKRCSHSFHAEIGKFRFLNVMIKLVSPKYLGHKTAPAVRRKILELLAAWTRDYPREVKIKETYEMLKKQGVIKEADSPLQTEADGTNKTGKTKNPIFENEETTKLLQELLRSKDPFDLKLANKLIKSMVKEDEKRVQLNCQRNMELESVHANAKLLGEMLDSYDPGKSSSEDVELMKELYDACERLKPTVTRLAYESQDNEEIGEVLAANAQLSQVFEKYASTMILGREGPRRPGSIVDDASASLLDLSSPTDSSFAVTNEASCDLVPSDLKSNIEIFGDIFGSLGNSSMETPQPASVSSINESTLVFPDTNIMQPVSILPTMKTKELQNSTVKLDSKARALEDLNQLGESLLKESLSQSTTGPARNVLSNVSSNLTIETSTSSKNTGPALMYVNPSSSNDPLPGTNKTRSAKSVLTAGANGLCRDKSLSNDTKIDTERMCDVTDSSNNEDDAMLDASSSSPVIEVDRSTNHSDDKCRTEGGAASSIGDGEIKPLTDIRVSIDTIKPATIPPLTVIEEKNGISVVLHFAEGGPRPDVRVVVVTTMSKNSKALSNYLFQAVVPKQFKCRLQPPSGTELPGHNPFLPPSAITQIMLIANPRKETPSLKFMLSYTMGDETFTEMGEVDELPKID